jgi:hypothetical protein
MWNLISVRSKAVLVLEQDWSTVCAKRTIGLEIVLDTPECTEVTRLKWKLVSVCVGDGANLDAR